MWFALVCSHREKMIMTGKARRGLLHLTVCIFLLSALQKYKLGCWFSRCWFLEVWIGFSGNNRILDEKYRASFWGDVGA